MRIVGIAMIVALFIAGIIYVEFQVSDSWAEAAIRSVIVLSLLLYVALAGYWIFGP